MDLITTCSTTESSMQAVKWYVSMGSQHLHDLRTLLRTHFRYRKLSSMETECIQILSDIVKSGSHELLKIILPYVSEDFLFQTINDKSYISKLLHSAITKDNVEMVQLLVKRGASVDGFYQGKPLLHYTLSLGQLDIAKTLVRAGADVTSVDSRGDSPLFSVIYSSIPNKADIVEWLISRGVDPKQKGSSGKEPIHVAAAHSGLVIDKLVNAGCDVNTQDVVNGDSPLHVACARCCKDAIVTLIQYGAKINLQNNVGETPLSVLLKFAQDYHNFHAQTRRNLAKDLVLIGFRILPSQNKAIRTMRGRGTTCLDKGAEVYKKLVNNITKPNSLQHICRLRIREEIKENAVHKIIKDLEIPKHLQEYLLFKDGALAKLSHGSGGAVIDNVVI